MATEAGIEIGQLAGGQPGHKRLPLVYPARSTPVRRAYNSGTTVSPEDSPNSLCEGFFPFTGNAADGNTIQVGTVTYTFRNAFTPAANEVKIGADRDATIANAVAAINLSGTAGTEYAAGTAIHPDVTGEADAVNHYLRVYSKTNTGGAILLAKSGANISNPQDVNGNANSPYALWRVIYGQATLHVLGVWASLVGAIQVLTQSSIVVTVHAGDGVLQHHAVSLKIPLHAALTGPVLQSLSSPLHEVMTGSDLIRCSITPNGNTIGDAGWWGYLLPTDANGNESL